MINVNLEYRYNKSKGGIINERNKAWSWQTET